MSRNPDPMWTSSVNFLRSLAAVPAAQANAGLAEQAKEEWDGEVVCRTSMHDLWFTLPGDTFPWSADVRVSWAHDIFQLRLSRNGLLVTADRCRADVSREVLDSFLHQLVAEA
jgi:hypothetical protein